MKRLIVATLALLVLGGASVAEAGASQAAGTQWAVPASAVLPVAGTGCVFDAPSGVATIDGTDPLGHVGWGFELAGGSWEFGGNEGADSSNLSHTWYLTGTWWQMLSAFQGAGFYHPAGYYTQYRCVSFSTSSAHVAAAEETVTDENGAPFIVPTQDCESQTFNVLAAYGVRNMPSDLSIFTWPSPNNWFSNLNIAGFGAAEPL